MFIPVAAGILELQWSGGLEIIFWSLPDGIVATPPRAVRKRGGYKYVIDKERVAEIATSRAKFVKSLWRTWQSRGRSMKGAG